MNKEKSGKGAELAHPLVYDVLPIAEAAGKVLLSYYNKKNLKVTLKNGDAYDPVTRADIESDDLIRKSLCQLFPDDLILSEENSDIPSDYSKRVWMIDPLDGTKEFILGSGGFAINIGLWSREGILFGLVYAPVSGRAFYAAKGAGAFELVSGVWKKIAVSPVAELDQARLITRTPGADTRPLDELENCLVVKKKITDSRLKICRIAAGEAEAHINTNFRASKWDTLAPQLILEEAGGVVVNLRGKPLDYRQASLRWDQSYIAANNRIILGKILAALAN
jgi:3'(2'), 5'-bisphosphate nucleotidase